MEKAKRKGKGSDVHDRGRRPKGGEGQEEGETVRRSLLVENHSILVKGKGQGQISK